MPKPPSGSVTFLFSDIEGSTRLWEQHPEAMRPALARHDRILRQAIETGGGYVFKTLGDAFCAAFASAPAAVQAALAAQIALAAEAATTEPGLRVRMALHTGDAEECDGDYFGPPLNRTARLMATGYGGQTLLSLPVQELTRDQLPADAALREMGLHRLKDLARPETVFQLLHPALPADFPPLKSLDNPRLPNNLPPQVTSFIGREKEMAEVRALLMKTRLLTLTGAGGSGKTRLSLQAATDLLDGDGDGVRLVELAPLSDPALVPQAVAEVFGIREEPGKTLRQSLVDGLKPLRLLLVLDNCEHLLSACGSLVTEMLRQCPDIRLLVTSREPLNVAGEQTYRVPSLLLPDPKSPHTVESLSQSEAAHLFTERARAVQPTFTVTRANAPVVAAVCHRLDGIPLALELAAARMRSLSVEEINARLDNRFRLLIGGHRTLLPRQQTLRALIDWSYDLLTSREKTLLTRLSVFAGGWTLSAAESVCGDAEIEREDVLDLLTALADKSIVTVQTGSDETRYRLLETVRQYAADRLEEDERAAAHDRHLAWCMALAEEAEPQLTGPAQKTWLARLETEHDNLRAGLTWCERQSQADSGLRLAGALWRFWLVRGHFTEGRQWLSRVLARASDIKARPTRAKALNGAGALAHCQGDYGVARAFHGESLALQRQMEDQPGIATSLLYLGNAALGLNEYAAAQILYDESLTLRRQLNDRHGIAGALSSLGKVACAQGDYPRARVLGEEALALRRQMGDDQGTAASLGNIGEIACAQGAYAQARALLTESLALYRQLGNQSGIAIALGSLGEVACAQNEYVLAQGLLTESLTIYRELGDQPGIAYGLETTAEVAQGRHKTDKAVRLVGAADALRLAAGAPLSLLEREKIDRRLSAARASLGSDAFLHAWNAGRAMMPDEAIEYALAEP